MEFKFNESTKVEFSLNISGTQMKPSEVRVVLGNGPKQVFLASVENDNWSAFVTPLNSMVDNITQFAIEIVMNGKVFTPIKRQIQIQNFLADPVIQPELPTNVDDTLEKVEPTEIEKVTDEPIVDMQNEPTPSPTPISVTFIKDIFLAAESVEQKPTAQTLKISEAAPLSKLKAKTKHKIKIDPIFDKKPLLGIEVNPEKVTKSIFAEDIKYEPKIVTKALKDDIINIESVFEIKKTDVIFK